MGENDLGAHTSQDLAQTAVEYLWSFFSAAQHPVLLVPPAGKALLKFNRLPKQGGYGQAEGHQSSGQDSCGPGRSPDLPSGHFLSTEVLFWPDGIHLWKRRQDTCVHKI